MKLQKNYVAYQTVDPEGDIWCNEAFLFETQELANIFFKDVKKLIASLKHVELDELSDEVLNNLDSCLKVYEYQGDINMVELNLDDVGFFKFKRMSCGVLITSIE